MSANGLTFACLEGGPPNGPLALLLHGYPDTAHSWAPTVEVLAGHGYRVVAPCMRGYYPTEIPRDGDYSARTLGQDVLGLVHALGAEQAVVIANDWGSFAAYSAVSQAPERVSKLVQISIPHPKLFRLSRLTPRRAILARHFLLYRLPGAARRVRRNDYAHLDRIYRRWSPAWTGRGPEELAPIKHAFEQPGHLDAALAYYRGLPLTGTPAFLQKPIAVPSRLFAGLADGVADLSLFEESAQHFTGPFELIKVPEAGHFLHREQPDAFHAGLLEFLGASG